MSSLAFVRPAAACVVAGAALFVSRGVIDQIVTADGVRRLALLPPWLSLAGFVGVAALMLLGIAHLNAPRATTTGRRPHLGELSLPLFGLAVLVVPFLPVLSDRWPVLQVLAGPVRDIVWLLVVTQLVWVLWQARLITPRWIERWSIGGVTLSIWLGTAALSAAAASQLAGTALFPGGDEPHYMVIAQSLWLDHDLKIENNHTRGDYHEYFRQDIAPHYRTRGSDGEIYSIHPVGMPLLMAPFYGAGGYWAVVAALILLAATAAALAWWWTVGVLNTPGAATFAWAAIAGSSPFLFNTFTVYPEMAGAVAVMVALVFTVKADRSRSQLGRWLAVGVACGTLPWLSTKYAPMSAVLVGIALARHHAAKKGSDPFSQSAAVLLPYLASLAAWFWFFYAYWGTPWPQAPYGVDDQTSPWTLVVGAPGLLFDQEYGLLAYAPVYALAATGLLTLWRAGGDLRRQAVEITLTFAALLATVGAFGIWWGGSAAPGRPVSSGLMLMSLPIAAAFRAAPAGSPRRAGQHALLWIGAGIAVTLMLAQDGLLINNGRDGSSSLLEWWSPRWELWTLAPSFTQQEALPAYLQTAWWLVVAGVASALLVRSRINRPGLAALSAIGTLGGGLLVLAATMPLLPASAPAMTVNLNARTRLAAIDQFDERARPFAVLYGPVRLVGATDALALLALRVSPDNASQRQPIRLIHNGRLSLPAGRYDVDVSWDDRVPSPPVALSAQVGRIGPPFVTWNPDAQSGQRWRAGLALAVDASFVGFRGSPDVERAIKSITITPTALVDEGARPRTPLVLAAAQYEGASVFFHDEQLFPEPTGFWTMGKRRMSVTLAPGADGAPIVLRMHSGAVPNQVTLTTPGWAATIDLVPGEAQQVTLPVTVMGLVPLTIQTADGFSPSQFDPTSQDKRFLGVWVELATQMAAAGQGRR